MKLRGGLGNRGRGSLLLISIVSAFLIVAGGFLSAASASGGNTDTSAFTGACAKLPSPSAPDFTNRFNQFVMQLCYQKQNWKHDANRRTSQGIHDTFVKMWYSPSLFKWMTVLNRQGPVPDGSIAIKEEYMDGFDFPHPFLERDGQGFKPLVGRMGLVGRWDRNHRRRGRAGRDFLASTGCAEPAFPLNGPTSINCIGCHASAISTAPAAGTFSAPGIRTSLLDDLGGRGRIDTC